MSKELERELIKLKKLEKRYQTELSPRKSFRLEMKIYDLKEKIMFMMLEENMEDEL